MANIYDTAAAEAIIGGINVTINSVVYFAENWNPQNTAERLDIPGEDNRINGQIWSDQPKTFTATLLASTTTDDDATLGREFTAPDHIGGTVTWVIEETGLARQVGSLWKFDISGVEKITPAALTAPS